MASWDLVYFQELDGERRRVTLKATEAPHGHFRSDAAIKGLGRETRRTRHEIAGQSIPDIHVTGTKLKDLVLKVHFRDSLTGQDGRALEMVNTIDAIQVASRPLRLVWGAKIYNALLLDSDVDGEAEGEFTAMLTFERYDLPRIKPTPPPSLALPTSVGDIDDLITATHVKFGFSGINLDFGQQLESLFSALGAPIETLISLAEDIESGVTEAFDGLKQVANMASALLNRLNALAAYLGSTDDPTNDPASRAAWKRAQADALVNLHRAAVSVRDLGVSAETKAQGKTSGKTYIVRDGDTIEAIAAKFGTSTEKLRSLNPSLTGGPLVAGTKLKLP